MKTVMAAISLLLAVCAAYLVYQNDVLEAANKRLRDRIHGENLLVTGTNTTHSQLVSQAYVNHALEKAGKFGSGAPPFFGLVFYAAESECSSTKGDTMLLLDERFKEVGPSLDSSLGVEWDGKLYRIESGILKDASNN